MTADPPPTPAPLTTRVVVAYDGSTSARAALAAGVEQAVRHDLPLLLATAVEVGDPVWAPGFCESATEMLRATAERCRADHPGLDVSTTVLLGSPTVAVLGQARPHDLLVVGTQGHRPVSRVLLGSTSSSLVTHARQPVLVARSSAVTPDAPVVVGVDGSPSSLAAVEVAAQEAHHAGVTLRAVRAVPPVVDPLGFVAGTDPAHRAEAEARLAWAVSAVRARYPDLVIDPQVSRTHPVEALLRASRDARLLVLGSRGLGTFGSILLGSVSRAAVQHATTSVLVIRPSQAGSTTSPRAREGVADLLTPTA